MRHIFLIILFLSCFFGCADEKSAPEKKSELDTRNAKSVIATINNEKIYKHEFQSWYDIHKRRFRRKQSIDKKKALRQYIQFRMLVKKAKEKGYDKKPSVQQMMHRAMVRLYMADHIHRKVQNIHPDESELKRYFKENKDRFSRPELKRFSVIVMNCQNKGPSDTCKDKMNLLEKEVNNANFKHKTKELSEELYSKRRGGDIGFTIHPSSSKWKKKIGIEKKALRQAFALVKQGSLSKPILIGKKIYMFMLTGFIPSHKISYSSQKGRIKSVLMKERKKKMTNSLFSSIQNSYHVSYKQQ